MYRTCKESITFSNNEIEKQKFYCIKNEFFKKDVDIDNILISNMISSDRKKL